MNVPTQSLGDGVAELLSVSAAQRTQFLSSHLRLDDFTKVGSVIRPEAVLSFCPAWANMLAKSIHERSEGESRAQCQAEAMFSRNAQPTGRSGKRLNCGFGQRNGLDDSVRTDFFQ